MSQCSVTQRSVATALRAVFLCENDTDADRPQVRTLDGLVLRRSGGYNIYQIAITLLSLVQNNRRAEQPA